MIPLWDTFEASYFFVAGLFAGAVFGFLFPSLWRTVRRRFRSTDRYSLPDLPIIPSAAAEVDNPEFLSLDDTSVERDLVHARSLAQMAHYREAIAAYVAILKSEQISKGQTNTALYELAQTYAHLGMRARALDIALDLLHRRSRSLGAFQLALSLVSREDLVHRLDHLLKIWNGATPDEARRQIAHLLCLQAETQLEVDLKAALSQARRALRWDLHASRPRILLWITTGRRLLADPNPRQLLVTLPAHIEVRLRIQQETPVSLLAGSDHLKQCVSSLQIHSPELANPESILDWLFGQMPDSVTRDELALLLQTTTAHANDLHKCAKCSMLFESFLWKCPHCNSLESLFPFSPQRA